ncbi:unnamed protein product [Prorocentrum cordatum]|uniref:Uncharacterized protein n=1 Tax=Prorocentrum cordatum TaxID=2364126 RepID=A0ABN9TWJ5_9DINO|nr:unnamed protein product [Polarella glacialis]
MSALHEVSQAMRLAAAELEAQAAQQPLPPPPPPRGPPPPEAPPAWTHRGPVHAAPAAGAAGGWGKADAPWSPLPRWICEPEAPMEPSAYRRPCRRSSDVEERRRAARAQRPPSAPACRAGRFRRRAPRREPGVSSRRGAQTPRGSPRPPRGRAPRLARAARGAPRERGRALLPASVAPGACSSLGPPGAARRPAGPSREDRHRGEIGPEVFRRFRPTGADQ